MIFGAAGSNNFLWKWKLCRFPLGTDSAALLSLKLLSAGCFGLLVSMIKSQKTLSDSIHPPTHSLIHSLTPPKRWTAAQQPDWLPASTQAQRAKSKQVSDERSRFSPLWSCCTEPGLKHRSILHLTGSERRIPDHERLGFLFHQEAQASVCEELDKSAVKSLEFIYRRRKSTVTASDSSQEAEQTKGFGRGKTHSKSSVSVLLCIYFEIYFPTNATLNTLTFATK